MPLRVENTYLWYPHNKRWWSLSLRGVSLGCAQDKLVRSLLFRLAISWGNPRDCFVAKSAPRDDTSSYYHPLL